MFLQYLSGNSVKCLRGDVVEEIMIGVDLFSGAGGMSLGATLAGIDVRFAIEMDCNAAATCALNHPHTTIINKDISKIKEVDIPSKKGGTILFGGPPCQGFSTSNQRTRNIVNRDNWLFLEFMRIAKMLKPDWIILENVRGLAETANGLFLKHILKEFEDSGYFTTKWLLNAVDFGVPQKRSRLFIIGSKHGITPKIPVPTHSKHVTVNEAIADMPEIPNGASISKMPYKTQPKSEYARVMRADLNESPNHLVTRNSSVIIKRYKHVPQGGNWQDIPDKLMRNYKDPRMCHTGIYHRLRYDEPSVVIGNYRKNMLIHPAQDRGLSVREAARLQSFPDWYEFKGSIGFQQQQVGNAVPPLLAKAVFKVLLSLT